MHLATASTTVKFHDFPSGTVVHNYQPGTQSAGPVRSISWSKDGNWLAIVPNAGHAEIVSVKDQLKLLHTIQAIEDPSCASFQHTTKKHVAVGTKDGQVLIYDIKSRNVKKRFPRAGAEVSHIDVTVRDQHVAAAATNGDVLLYSNTTNGLTGKFKIPKSQSVNCIRTNPITRNHIAGGSCEGVVAVWDLNVNKTKFSASSHNAPVTAVVFSPVNSDLVVSTGLDRLFCFYDVGSGKKIADVFTENSMVAADFSADGKYIAAASQKGQVFVYDSRNLQEAMHTFSAHNSAVKHLSFRRSEDHAIDSSVTSVIFEPDVVNNRAETKSSRHQSNGDGGGGGSSSLSFNLFQPSMERSQGDSKVEGRISETADDSFMAEMGLDKDTTDNSTRKDADRLFLLESLKKMAITTTPSSCGASAKLLLQQEMAGDAKASVLKASTPKMLLLQQQESTTMSPIITQNETQRTINANDVEEMVKRAVKAEMQSALEEIKKMLSYEKNCIMSETRQLHYNTLMAMVKESIKVENGFNTIRADLLAVQDDVAALKSKFNMN